MQDEMRRARNGAARHHSLELRSRFQPLHVFMASVLRLPAAGPIQPLWTVRLDSQPLAAFGAPRVDHGATSAGFHADQKTVSARAADFGGLVGTFHLKIPVVNFRTALDYRKFIELRQHLTLSMACNAGSTASSAQSVITSLIRHLIWPCG